MIYLKNGSLLQSLLGTDTSIKSYISFMGPNLPSYARCYPVSGQVEMIGNKNYSNVA
jgi:hypothetical protein